MKTTSLINLAVSALMASASPLTVASRAQECLLKCRAGDVCIVDPTPRCAVPGGICGGFAGLKCTNAADECVDDPRDDCDPLEGWADCIGVCVAPRTVY